MPALSPKTAETLESDSPRFDAPEIPLPMNPVIADVAAEIALAARLPTATPMAVPMAPSWVRTPPSCLFSAASLARISIKSSASRNTGQSSAEEFIDLGQRRDRDAATVWVVGIGVVEG